MSYLDFIAAINNDVFLQSLDVGFQPTVLNQDLHANILLCLLVVAVLRGMIMPRGASFDGFVCFPVFDMMAMPNWYFVLVGLSFWIIDYLSFTLKRF